jgi:hypothetical protein
MTVSFQTLSESSITPPFDATQPRYDELVKQTENFAQLFSWYSIIKQLDIHNITVKTKNKPRKLFLFTSLGVHRFVVGINVNNPYFLSHPLAPFSHLEAVSAYTTLRG